MLWIYFIFITELYSIYHLVGDEKTPREFKDYLFSEIGSNEAAPGHSIGDNGKPRVLEDTVVILNVTDQHSLAAKIPFLKMLPWNSFARKNVGYLYAIMHGARYVWDFDDDNIIQQEGNIWSYNFF